MYSLRHSTISLAKDLKDRGIPGVADGVTDVEMLHMDLSV